MQVTWASRALRGALVEGPLGADAGAPVVGEGYTRGAGAPNSRGAHLDLMALATRDRAAGAGGAPTGRDCTGLIGADTRSVWSKRTQNLLD